MLMRWTLVILNFHLCNKGLRSCYAAELVIVIQLSPDGASVENSIINLLISILWP